MSLELHFHPLSSFCQKAVVALYESGIAFDPVLLDLADPAVHAAFSKLWPLARMPVLRDRARDRVVPEATMVIEYLALHFPDARALVPENGDDALATRERDRFFDLYVNEPMQKVVTDKLRPAGKNDPFGVERARQTLTTAYGIIERDMAKKTWAIGDTFTMADCAAAPALDYANKVHPLGDAHPAACAYLARLKARPSYARVLTEAEPYLRLFPG